jgi:hypothetical protein
MASSSLDSLLAPLLGQPAPSNQGPVTKADALNAAPMVAAIGEMLRMDIQRSSGGHQPWQPEFTDSPVIAARGDNPWTPSKEVPVYIQPTGVYGQGKASKIGQTAALTAPDKVPPTGVPTIDAWRAMGQRIADGDIAASGLIQQQVAPIDERIAALTTKNNELHEQILLYGSSTLAKDLKTQQEGVAGMLKEARVEREFALEQVKQHPDVVQWLADRSTLEQEQGLLEKTLQSETQIQQQEATAKARERIALENAPAKAEARANAEKRLQQARAEAKLDVFPAQTQALVQRQGELLAAKAKLKAEGAPAEQLAKVDTELAIYKGKLREKRADLTDNQKADLDRFSARQEVIYGFDKQGADYKQALHDRSAVFLMDESTKRQKQMLDARTEKQRETWQQQQKAINAITDEKERKRAQAALDKQQLTFAQQDKRDKAKRTASNEDWDRRQAAVNARTDAKDKEKAQAVLDKEMRAAGRNDLVFARANTEYDRRQKEINIIKDANAKATKQAALDKEMRGYTMTFVRDELKDTTKAAEWDRQQTAVNAIKDERRKQDAQASLDKEMRSYAFRADQSDLSFTRQAEEFDRRRLAIDAEQDTDRKAKLEADFQLYKDKAIFGIEEVIPRKDALELDQAQKLIQAKQEAELNGLSVEKADMEYENWYRKFATTASAGAMKALQRMEGAKDLKAFSAEVEALYAPTKEDKAAEAAAKMAANTDAKYQTQVILANQGLGGEATQQVYQEAVGTSYGESVNDPLRNKNAEQILADAQSAKIYGEQGYSPQAIKNLGRPVWQQDFASRLMANRQSSPEGQQAMRAYSQELMQIKNDERVIERIAPDLNLRPDLKESVDKAYLQLWNAKQSASGDTAKAESQGQIDAWVATQLGSNRDGLASQAVERATLRFAKGQFVTHNDEMQRALLASIDVSGPQEEVRAQQDMVRVLDTSAWLSWGTLALALRDAAEWNTDVTPTGLTVSGKSGIERMRALELAGQMLHRVVKLIDDRTENTLSKSGYEARQSIEAGLAAAKAKTLMESVGADVFLRRLDVMEPAQQMTAQGQSAQGYTGEVMQARPGWVDPLDAVRGLPMPSAPAPSQPVKVQPSQPAARPGWDNPWQQLTNGKG